MVSTGKSTGYFGILAGITTGLVTVLIAALGQTPAVLAASAEKHIADQIIFGNAASDRAHHLVLHHAKFIVGGLHQTALRLQPLSPPQDDGGYATLTMSVNPNRRYYVTCQFWGSDYGLERGRLILSCNGKQVGYQVQGDYNTLNGAENAPPVAPFRGRFYFVTTPLPLRMTRHKAVVNLKIQAIGREWPYGGNWKQYQHIMPKASLGMYRLFIGTDGFFTPPNNDPQGRPLAPAPVRKSPGPAALTRLKQAVNRYVAGILRNKRLPDGMNHLDVLAKAYNTSWSIAWHKTAVVQRLIKDLDLNAIAAVRHAGHGNRWQSFSNAGWSTFGPGADAIRRDISEFRPFLKKRVVVNGRSETRGKLWGTVLKAGRDYLEYHQRLYSNQCMIVEYNLYVCNRALEQVEPSMAWPEKKALHFLKIGVGLAPYLGSKTAHGWQRPEGNHYYVVTRAGLTRELGYVATYGEIQDWPYKMWRASGNAEIKKQYEKIYLARRWFRYPSRDSGGYRCMKLEEVIGWRHDLYPSIVAYGDPSFGSMMEGAAAFGMACPQAVGYAQQCLADNQFFRAEQQAPSQFFRGTTVLIALNVPRQYAMVKAMPASPYRLPMSHGQANFVWADPQNAVVVVKHGHDRLWEELYYRGQMGINRLARVHFTQPRIDRLATVNEQVQFTPSGMYSLRPNWTDVNFRPGYTRQDDAQQAFAGQKLPIPQLPSGYHIHAGKNGQTNAEGPYIGRAGFYRLRFGHYLIAVNTTASHIYKLAVPRQFRHARNLVIHKSVVLAPSLAVGPQQTMVFYAR